MKTRTAIVALLLLCLLLAASAQVPVIFFTDLTAGPNTGNGDTTFTTGNGAYVTIYGRNFGASQGASTITWNGQSCLTVIPATGNYSGWGSAHLWYQKIIVQVMSTCTPGTGNFVVTTSGGTSNGMSFIVRALGGTHIFRAQSSGGTHTTPIACRDAMTTPGDICYVKNVNQTSSGGFSAMDLGKQTGTSWTNPVAMIVYPGATSIIGTDNADKGIEECVGYSPQCDGPGQPNHFLILAGFEVHGVTYAISIQGANVRYVGVKATCPNATKTPDMPGCFNTINSFETLFGNEVYNVGFNRLPDNAGKYQHSFYIGAGNDFEIGWNYSHDGNGGRLTQFFNGTSASYNIAFHDNVLARNVNVDCVTFDVNPGLGAAGVKIYNNLIYSCGKAPAQGADYGGSTCMYFQSSGATPTVRAQVYNNTMYDCGTTAAPFVKGGINPGVVIDLHNNIMLQTNAALPYLASGGGPASNVTGSNNVWNGAGTGPTQTTGNINANPLFVANGTDFHIQTSSPAKVAGVASWSGGAASVNDLDGLLRPSPPSVGAYEFAAASGSPSVQLSVASLNFGAQTVGSTSTAQNVTLTNNGTAMLTITSISLTGANPADFAISSNPCGTSLAASTSCIVGVTFTPSVAGARSASLTFTTNAATSPDNVTLSGTGGLPIALFSPTSTAFGGVKLGQSSLPVAISLTNTGNGTMNISSISMTGANPGDFSQNNNCGAALAVSASCTINVTFTPLSPIARAAILSVASNAATSPNTVPLTGSGLISVISGSGSISGNATITVHP